MSDFIGINQFGSLTSKLNGQKISFNDLKKFDINENGVIEEEEFSSALKELQLDSVELSTVDANDDKTISKEEFKVWDQKVQIQEAVNEKLKEIYDDPVLNKYMTNISNDLKQFMNSFIDEYKSDTVNMALIFKNELGKKFASLKSEYLGNDPSTVKNDVLDNIYNSLLGSKASDGKTVTEEEVQLILTSLEPLIDNYVSSYKGNTLKTDLNTYIEDFLNTSDADRIAEASDKFDSATSSISGYVSSDDLKQVQTAAREFLQTCVDKGVRITVGSINVASANAIESALAQYTNGSDLISAIKTAAKSVSTSSKKDEIIDTARLKAEQQKMKEFASISGSEYQIDASKIDWTEVDSRYFKDEEIHERGKGWSGSRDKAYDEGLKILNGYGLKNQVISQIEKMLKSKNIPKDIYENTMNVIIENIYNQSVQDTLNTEDMITGRGARGLSSKGHAYIKVKNLCDTFITNFNTNVAKYIDEMNASFTDFDTIDLDFSNLNLDEDGMLIKDDNNEEIKDDSSCGGDIAKSYATGVPLHVRKHGAEYYMSIAEKVIDGMKSQMLKKAMNMCKANGIEFDQSVFNAHFNNAKSIATNLAVTGITSKGEKIGGIAGASGGALAGAGVALGAGALTATTTTTVATGAMMWTAGLEALVPVTETVTSTTLLGSAAAASTVPVAGWIIGGAAALTAIGLMVFGGGRHSESSLNTKQLIDTFTENFKQNYTAWVDSEKGKVKTEE